jgi:hypothetical protein
MLQNSRRTNVLYHGFLPFVFIARHIIIHEALYTTSLCPHHFSIIFSITRLKINRKVQHFPLFEFEKNHYEHDESKNESTILFS